jgi:hypothetical protein
LISFFYSTTVFDYCQNQDLRLLSEVEVQD